MYDVDVPVATDTSQGDLEHYGLAVVSKSLAFIAYSDGTRAWSGHIEIGAGEVNVAPINLTGFLPSLQVSDLAVGKVGQFSTAVALGGTIPASIVPVRSYIGIQVSRLGTTQPVRFLAFPNTAVRHPAVAGENGRYFVAFTASDAAPDGSPVGTPAINIYDSQNDLRRDPGLVGSHPAVAISNSTLYLAHAGTGEVFFGQSSDSGTSFTTASLGNFDVADLRLQVSADDNVHLLILTTGGELHYATGSGGSLGAPALVTSGVSSAQLSLTNAGFPQVSVGGSGGARVLWGAPLAIKYAFGAAITKPYVASDHWGYLNLLYTDPQGEIHYTNNAPLPTVSFFGRPRSGQVPLEVTFYHSLTDPVINLRWDFGDGTVTLSGRSEVVEHVYETVGLHTITLTALGPGGAATVTRTNHVSVAAATEVFGMPRIRVFPGQTNVTVPIRYTHGLDEVQGFQVAGRFDPTVLTLTQLSSENTLIDKLRRDTEIFNIFEDSFTGGVLFLFTPPFPPEGVFLASGSEERLVHTVWDVNPSAAIGTETTVVLEGRDDGVLNVYSQESQRVAPHTVDGVFEIVDDDETDLFIRGDCNMDGILDTSDAINILHFILLGVEENTKRLDACDVDDSGELDISDAINLLGFVFLGSSAPPHPWPTRGLDPTDDTLPFAP
jgi:PKD repeat protein